MDRLLLRSGKVAGPLLRQDPSKGLRDVVDRIGHGSLRREGDYGHQSSIVMMIAFGLGEKIEQ